jgi:hypothetical protein
MSIDGTLSLDVGVRNNTSNVRLRQAEVATGSSKASASTGDWDAVLARISNQIDDQSATRSDSRWEKSYARCIENLEFEWQRAFETALKHTIGEATRNDAKVAAQRVPFAAICEKVASSEHELERELENNNRRATEAVQQIHALAERFGLRDTSGGGGGGGGVFNDAPVVIRRAIENCAVSAELWQQRAADLRHYFHSVLGNFMSEVLDRMRTYMFGVSAKYDEAVSALEKAKHERNEWRRRTLAAMPAAEERQRKLDGLEYDEKSAALFQRLIDTLRKGGDQMLRDIDAKLQHSRSRWKQSDQEQETWAAQLKQAHEQHMQQLVSSHRAVVDAFRNCTNAQARYGETLVAWTATKSLNECLKRMKRTLNERTTSSSR